MRARMIEIGPLTLSRQQWSRFKIAIRDAFAEWDAWSGGQGDVESREQYKLMVAEERGRVFGVIDQLEDVSKGIPRT